MKLFLFEKCAGDPAKSIGTILFVHGSSMASQPTFDLQVPGRPDSSAMDHFARLGFDCWCVDMEGYGRSTKDRDNNAPISQGADDCYAAALYIQKLRGKRPFLVYGISSGALRAAMFAERHPEMVARLALDAMVWTGEGSPTLEQRRKRLPEFQAKNRRPIDKAFIHSIFDRDHPGTAEEKVINAFADAVTALDTSVPTGTYVDMCSRLPVVNPEKITVPTLIMRGQWDGIASIEDLLKFLQGCQTRTNSSRSCPASRTQASSRRTTCWSITFLRASSPSRSRFTEAEGRAATREREICKLSWPAVMAGLVPAISLGDARQCHPERGHRDKPVDDRLKLQVDLPARSNPPQRNPP